MIEGLLRSCTDADIGTSYIDTHGASVVGFAFAELLGFRLLPQLKNIGSTGSTDPTTPARRTTARCRVDPPDPVDLIAQ